MSHSHGVLIAGVAWTTIAFVLFLAVGTVSVLSLAILAVGGLVPPLVYAALSGGPSDTIAQVLHDTERGGPGR